MKADLLPNLRGNCPLVRQENKEVNWNKNWIQTVAGGNYEEINYIIKIIFSVRKI